MLLYHCIIHESLKHRVYMRRLAPLINTEEAQLWVEHALQLPAAVVARFRASGLTGNRI